MTYEMAMNSTWCGKDEEFKSTLESSLLKLQEYEAKYAHLRFFCSKKLEKNTFKGDSGSPMVLRNDNGRWTLVAIVRGFHNFQWKDQLCSLEPRTVTVDDYQALVPNLPWIYDTLSK